MRQNAPFGHNDAHPRRWQLEHGSFLSHLILSLQDGASQQDAPSVVRQDAPPTFRTTDFALAALQLYFPGVAAFAFFCALPSEFPLGVMLDVGWHCLLAVAVDVREETGVSDLCALSMGSIRSYVGAG